MKTAAADGQLDAASAKIAQQYGFCFSHTPCSCLKLMYSSHISACPPAEDYPAGGAKKKGAAGKAGAKAGAHKPPKSAWQRASKLLFGWTNSTFKVNGKKLLPHNAVLWRFMVSGSCQIMNE
jgi:hypothetical protein